MTCRSPFSLVLAMVLSASVLEASVTVQDLTTMANAKHPEYRGLRDAIVSQGESVLPELDRIYNDQSLDWKPRFAAGVCIEHIRRADDLHAFLSHDWLSEPGFREAGPILATGYPRDCGPIVHKVKASYGLWFYYLEVYAKRIYPEEDTKDYRILGTRSVLVENSRGEARFFAARMAGMMFDENCPPNELIMGPLEGYLEDLSTFVSDGTYPEGKELIFKHLNAYHPILLTFLDNERDVLFLEKVAHDYPNDKRLQKRIRNRLRDLRSDTLLVPSNTPLEPPTERMETPAQEPSPLPPVAESTLVSEKDHKRRSLIAPIAAVLVVLAGTAFLLLKRRRRP